MFELTIGGKVYEFNFGMGFMREINKKIGVPVDGLPDVKKNMGLQYTVAGIIDGDLEALVDALEVANKGRVPRATREILDGYIDDPDTDIDKLFEEVMGFLKHANATKKTMETLQKAIEAEKQKQMNL